MKPVFKDRIWGGTKLHEVFGYDIPSETTGECWGISAHPNGPSEVLNGPLAGKTLIQLWNEYSELFGNQGSEEFPLLVKILDAKTDLSVQVHPDDTYAREVEGDPYGKTECWYIIDCEPGAELVYGHHATSKSEFVKMVEEKRWDDLLRTLKIKPGDFVYVPNGTIHAIGAGTMILETQQSSDITYRVYDYDRRDAQGNTRELHIEKSVEVSMIPHKDAHIEPVENRIERMSETKLVKEKYFTVYRWDLDGIVERYDNPVYLLVSVLTGDGEITTEEGSFPFKKGDHFIIPSTVKQFDLKGNAECIVSHPTI